GLLRGDDLVDELVVAVLPRLVVLVQVATDRIGQESEHEHRGRHEEILAVALEEADRPLQRCRYRGQVDVATVLHRGVCSVGPRAAGFAVPHVPSPWPRTMPTVAGI